MLALRQLSNLFQACLNKPGAPTRLKQTSPAGSAEDPAPPTVAQIINEPYPKVITHKTTAPAITSARTKRYRNRYNKANMIPQE